MTYYAVWPYHTFGFTMASDFIQKTDIGVVYAANKLLKMLSSGSDSSQQKQTIVPKKDLACDHVVPRSADWLKGIKGLQDNWNGYGSAAPNSVAFRAAEDVLLNLHGYGIRPRLVEASAENGIGISIKQGTTEAVIECFNDGDVEIIVLDNENIKNAFEVKSNPETIEEVVSGLYYDYLR